MRRAFSLVELSIVLVILGLLVGGILAGRSLIHAAELRSITADFNQYKTAVMTFRNKFFLYPGDLNNAQSFWGVLATPQGTCNTTEASAATGTGTCNGDGNGLIGNDDGLGYEPLRFWQHLANAGLVQGTFTGTRYNGTGYDVMGGVNVPSSKLKGSTWCARFDNAAVGGSRFFDFTRTGHSFILGMFDSGDPCEGSIMLPEDAFNVDTKMDDGKPSNGQVKGVNRTICTDSTGASDTAATYNLDSKSTDCALLFQLD